VLSSAQASPDSLIELAQAQAPDIAQALALEEKARSEELYRSRQSLPQLDAGVYARKGLLPEDANPSGIQFGARATFLWNIPDGVNRATAKKAILDLRKTGIAALKARRDLKRSLVRLTEDGRSRRQSLELALLVIQAQAARLQAAETGYRDGSASWSDLALARREWLNSLTSAWSAMATLQAGESDLQSLTGTGPSTLGWNWGN
jgi:outer membrane protein TolC